MLLSPAKVEWAAGQDRFEDRYGTLIGAAFGRGTGSLWRMRRREVAVVRAGWLGRTFGVILVAACGIVSASEPTSTVLKIPR
jgi:hypothetical protein